MVNPNFVVGVEADFDGVDLSASNDDCLDPFHFVTSMSNKNPDGPLPANRSMSLTLEAYRLSKVGGEGFGSIRTKICTRNRKIELSAADG
jgi:hypothetical protein